MTTTNIGALPEYSSSRRLPDHFFKNALDRTGAAFGLILLLPVIAFIAILVKKDGGSIFFGHTRVGLNGKPFKCWKFRSMVLDADKVLQDLLAYDMDAKAEWDRDFKLKNDPRITGIGQFLRKTSLDEIPQLYNVLKGEMSLVGPRPVVSAELKYYGGRIKDYYAARPGITGLWQVSGRNDVSYAERVELDSHYVNNWSFWRDFTILLETVGVIIYRKGAY